MKLLREYYELCEGGVCQDLLTEDEKRFVASGGMMLSGKLQEADVQNGNGRVYPHKVLMREVENYKKLVKEKRALLMLASPNDGLREGWHKGREQEDWESMKQERGG